MGSYVFNCAFIDVGGGDKNKNKSIPGMISDKSN